MKTPKTRRQWGLYNFGRLFCVCRTRKECKAEAEILCGAPWDECKKFMQVYKVDVSVADAALLGGE
jgi:hypothetical protein